MLKAGYLEDFTWGATLSGAPQGSGVSPVLSNIYLDKLDRFVQDELIPRYTRGAQRRRDPRWESLRYQRRKARRAGDRVQARQALAQMRRLPSVDPRDPGYRRLKYCRYADDSLFGFAGPKAEAEQIKDELAQFLRDVLKLEMSPDKTLITHAATGAAMFLGYEITAPIGDAKVTNGRRSANRRVRLRVPRARIKAKAREYTSRGKPASRPGLVGETDHRIVSVYGAEYRGYVQYYLLAGDVYRLNRLRGVMELSMLRTLAAKHHSTVRQMRRKYKVVIDTPHGKRTAFEARIERPGREPLVGRFGGIPLKRDKTARVADFAPRRAWARKELITRLLAGKCELCGARNYPVEAHQVRNLKALAFPGPPEWAKQMARMRRKTLILCPPCHAVTHTQTNHVTTAGRKAG
jgi:hypothetical protein